MGRDKRGRFLFVASFLSPALALYLLFVVWPFLQTFLLSTYRFRGMSSKRTFVGAQYYQNLWTDEVFWRALQNVLILVVVGMTVVMGLSLLLAHATTGKTRFGKALRGVYLFPQVISIVAVASLWRFVFRSESGLLAAMGVKGPENGWLGDVGTAWPVVVFVFVWVSLGFFTMLFGAGIGGIPAEVDEASQLEGITGWEKFWRITWPMLWSVRRVAVVYSVILAMNCFALVNVMTEGAPAERTEVMLNYLVELMERSQYGKAAALGVVNIAVATALAVGVSLLFRKNPEEGKAA